MKLLDDHKNGKADNSRRVWTVYTFLIWYKQFFSDSPREVRKVSACAPQGQRPGGGGCSR